MVIVEKAEKSKPETTMSRTKVGLIFGGKSAEHAVSLKSAAAIYQHLDRTRFDPVLFYINRQGDWCLTENDRFAETGYREERFFSFVPWEATPSKRFEADIYFPVLHGPNGEDGRIQGIFEMAGKPFVGAGSLGSALAMDKVVSKLLFARAGLRVAEYLHFTENNFLQISELVNKKLAYPLFVKPCSLGSSVGISKIRQEAELKGAVDLAFSYDGKILIEQGIEMREFEVSVMGNKELKISKAGELIPFHEFYDYQDKYLLDKTRFYIPAQLPPETAKEIRHTAQKAFRTLFLNGMARVDLFLENETGEIFVNEINTIPGFTEISMFPKLWQVEGISFAQLITQLIDYGFDHHRDMKSNVGE
jgi:D-alanine-D-alanine ligase